MSGLDRRTRKLLSLASGNAPPYDGCSSWTAGFPISKPYRAAALEDEHATMGHILVTRAGPFAVRAFHDRTGRMSLKHLIVTLEGLE